MKYAIFQINITGAESDEINSMDNPHRDHPKYRSHTCAMFEEWDKIDYSFYEHVANIEANDLEHVFHISNAPFDREENEARIERLARMHSLSVGDIVMTSDGACYGVEGIGFKDLFDLDMSSKVAA